MLNAASPFAGSTTAWAPVRPEYLADLRGLTVPATHSHVMQLSNTAVTWTQGAGAAAVAKSWNADVAAGELEPGATYEVSLTAANHPLHLHIYPMQVMGPCAALGARWGAPAHMVARLPAVLGA